ncbi:MAG TPA: hypothetical protein VKZ59_06635 [Acidobacteriota bacterium]|nr:hypothetical protein [Acidobacteriota bacterium]
MKYLVLFLVLIGAILWVERQYWKRRASLLESRLLGQERAEAVTNWIDAWIDGRIEARLQKERNRR